MLQVNPLAETTDGKLIAADAKIGFDDNAAFRQKDLHEKRDTSQEDARCVPLCSSTDSSVEELSSCKEPSLFDPRLMDVMQGCAACNLR